MRNTSLQLQGPCYPIIFPSINGKSDMNSWISSPRIFSKMLPVSEEREVHALIWSLSVTAVYWSCQFIARPSNVSLKHWQRMGGASIDENMLIDKTIHNTINYKSSVLKVCLFFAGIKCLSLYYLHCQSIYMSH
jgi:choline transporter-like protein 2/4/5